MEKSKAESIVVVPGSAGPASAAGEGGGFNTSPWVLEIGESRIEIRKAWESKTASPLAIEPSFDEASAGARGTSESDMPAGAAALDCEASAAALGCGKAAADADADASLFHSTSQPARY